MATITLSAYSDFGLTGQYIARLTGRAPRVDFSREFVGQKGGKRNESTSCETDEVGCYEINDQTRKGRDRKYMLVVPWSGVNGDLDELRLLATDKEDCMAICKRLDAGERFGEIVEISTKPKTKRDTESYCIACGTAVSGSHCPDHPQAATGVRTIEVPVLAEDGTQKRTVVYSLRSRVEAKRAVAAATEETAVETVLAALAALPTSLQRRVLTTVRARLFPKTENEAPLPECT
jgi:hypothetical protein